MTDVPRLFRTVLQVGDLAAAQRFYAELLDQPGRSVGGGRCYFDCGEVILALLQPQQPPRRNADDLYFAVRDLDAVFARAQRLSCLSSADVHGEAGGAIAVRPWGERSFYAEDAWGNGLCFVDAATLFTGQRRR